MKIVINVVLFLMIKLGQRFAQATTTELPWCENRDLCAFYTVHYANIMGSRKQSFVGCALATSLHEPQLMQGRSQSTTLHGYDLHNAQTTILNPFKANTYFLNFWIMST